MNSNEPVKVIELRNYLLKPGSRDEFSKYFARHFVESQNARGGFVLGGYSVANEPDRFFWIRGFSGMSSRSRFMPDFYGGEIWKKFGARANEMMLEWHRVHLLKPLKETKIGDFLTEKRFMTIDFYFVEGDKPEELIVSFKAEDEPRGSFWISEPSENDFPRLPVIQAENLLVRITNYPENEELGRAEKTLQNNSQLKKHERLILSRAF